MPVDDAEGEEIGSVVKQLRDLAGGDRDGLTVDVSGPAGLLADLIEVFSAIDGPLLLVTLVVVLIILLIVYRSPVLWIFPLLAAGMSYALASVFVYLLADADIVKLNGQAQGILTVLVFGAGTDYALLLIARYREELHRHDRPWDAMRTAWRGAAPAIIASGGTVIVSLLCLLLSSLNSNRALGPVAAIGIAATLLVMLTFLPALLVLGGRWAFWPRRPRLDQADPQTEHGLWSRIAGFVARHARPIWLGTAVVLALLTLGLTQLGATTLGQSDLFTQRTDSVDGQEVIARHYPAGTGSPATIFTTEQTARQVAQVAQGVPGRRRRPPAQPAGSRPARQTRTPPPKVVDGRVQLEATLADPPDSDGAERTIRELRESPCTGARRGRRGRRLHRHQRGHRRRRPKRDRNVIIPVVLVVIAVILALLLRALLAPLLLIAHRGAVVPATLGLCALLFRHVFGFPGVDSSFPLFAFVFLVALGHRLQHLPDEPGAGGVGQARHPGRGAGRARRHRRCDHLRRHRARRDVLRAGRPAAGGAGRAGHRGRRRGAARHDRRPVAAGAGAGVRHRAEGLVAGPVVPGRTVTRGGGAMLAETDVVIVGGGLAGLAAARRLHRAGVPWRLVEAGDRLGGRVATDVVDGYLLDRGFQVLNTAYPRLGTLLDLDTLDLG